MSMNDDELRDMMRPYTPTADRFAPRNLKDCPFCGMDEPDWMDFSGGDMYRIVCRGCGASTELLPDRALAYVDWNRRKA